MAMVMDAETHAKYQEICDQYTLAECWRKLDVAAFEYIHTMRHVIIEKRALSTHQRPDEYPCQALDAIDDSASDGDPIRQLVITVDATTEFMAKLNALDPASIQVLDRSLEIFQDRQRVHVDAAYKNVESIHRQLESIREAHIMVRVDNSLRSHGLSVPNTMVARRVLAILDHLTGVCADSHIVFLPGYLIESFAALGIAHPRTGADVRACIEKVAKLAK